MMKIVECCKLCKKSRFEVTVIQVASEGSRLTPGYCLNCQDWLLTGFIVHLIGIAAVGVGLYELFRGDYRTLLIGAVILTVGLTFPDIIGFLFYRSKG